MVLREATVGPLLGTSPGVRVGHAHQVGGDAQGLADDLGEDGPLPWPISVEAASTCTRPSGRAFQAPVTEARRVSPEPVKPQPCMNTEKPTPRFTGPGPALRAGKAARFSA